MSIEIPKYVQGTPLPLLSLVRVVNPKTGVAYVGTLVRVYPDLHRLRVSCSIAPSNRTVFIEHITHATSYTFAK